jgi:hypothetical protein
VKIFAYLVCLIYTLKFAADNLYETAYRAIPANRGYDAIRYLEAAAVFNPASVLVAQAERMVLPGAIPGNRILFFHPNDFDGLMMKVDESRVKGDKKEGRKYLFRAGKADPYSSMNRYEMNQLR